MLCIVVGRAKKCLDFAVTLHVVHFISCTVYSGIPSGMMWWTLTTCSIAIMTMLG